MRMFFFKKRYAKVCLKRELPHMSHCFSFSKDVLNPVERMRVFCAYINVHKEELDGIFLTGDIIDGPFRTSIQYLKETLESLPVL